MNIYKDTDLLPYNTFGISSTARELIEIQHVDELVQFVKHNPKSDIKILGGGSNLLLTHNIDAVVLKIAIPGIQIIEETQDYVIVESGAGENWHGFVLWCLDHGFGGLENLSLIPGCVGAAPMQNIGAYGVEQEMCFDHLSAIDLLSGEERVFVKEDCRFGYRESVFKRELKGRYCIVRVAYKLTKTKHLLHTEYGAIRETLSKNQITEPGIQDISDAVISIRRSKLPDPAIIGNAGSFFKNPVVSVDQYIALKSTHPTMPSYNVSEGEVKIPAGWLIEHCGFKGHRDGDTGVHKDQALVLVNYGKATGHDILMLAEKIQKCVSDSFQISIEAEVNIW